jgi:hypothetical protein
MRTRCGRTNDIASLMWNLHSKLRREYGPRSVTVARPSPATPDRFEARFDRGGVWWQKCGQEDQMPRSMLQKVAKAELRKMLG